MALSTLNLLLAATKKAEPEAAAPDPPFLALAGVAFVAALAAKRFGSSIVSTCAAAAAAFSLCVHRSCSHLQLSR